MNAFEEQDYHKRFDRQLWRKMLIFIRPFRQRLLILGMFMLALAGVDAVFPLMSKYAVDHFIVPGNLEGLGYFALVFAGLIIIQCINIYFFIALAGRIETGLTYEIRKQGFEHLQRLSLNYYGRTPVGWLMARMTSDCQRLGEFISWGLVDSVWGTSLMVLTASIMLVLNLRLALITLTVVPLLVIISIYFQKKILHSFRLVRKTNSRITGSFNEGIAGAKTTKTLVRERDNLLEFQELSGKMYTSSVQAAVFSSLFLPVVLFLGSIGTGLALWQGGGGVISGVVTYGTLVAFISYSVQFFEPLWELARVFAELQNAQASAERVFSMLEEKPEISDPPEIMALYGDVLKEDRRDGTGLQGSISFRNVTFGYKADEKVLENFNLEVKAGETIALVGETGSGKSTIVNLACRFYEPEAGEILVDGIEYRQRSLLWLQSNLGYVLQSPHLFSGTIADNIRYGRLTAGAEEIEAAARLVNAHEFIMLQEKGYDTEVGEGGSLLSTGQKQLISFARAVVANPRIFVLDEATSSVDTETERMIQDAIHQVLKNRTSFIIAHRLSTIRAADRILVIRHGRIEEEGSHQELLRQQGYYYRMYTHQFLQEREEGLIEAETG
ncbi:MAG: ABC transporter ATP-binding protein [Candidatus Cloacimonetes bacterium]|nr:ABC transporter ATP-binding protein [Candidatus Cloacimonadota bacterium]